MGAVDDLSSAFLAGVQATLGGAIESLCLLGAVAFPESAAKLGDVDFYAIVHAPFTDADRLAVVAMHDRLARAHSLELDGFYVTSSDARASGPPTNQLWPVSRLLHDPSWALHREHLRAGRSVVLLGPDPGSIVPPATWDEIDEALAREVAFVDCWVERAPAYSVLQLCRVLLTLTQRDVAVSKPAAAAWAAGALPEWAGLISTAWTAYPAAGTRELPAPDVNRFVEDARLRISGLRLEAAQLR